MNRSNPGAGRSGRQARNKTCLRRAAGLGRGQRPLGIPAIPERVAQSAVKLVIEPVLEADLDPEAYRCRPKRSAPGAVPRVHQLLLQGCTDVAPADLSKYFDTIRQAELPQCVARRISDRQVLNGINRWLKTPAQERDENGKRRMRGGKRSRCGAPQGGVISPLLANPYMNRFLNYCRQKGKGGAFQTPELAAELPAPREDTFFRLRKNPRTRSLTWSSTARYAISRVP